MYTQARISVRQVVFLQNQKCMLQLDVCLGLIFFFSLVTMLCFWPKDRSVRFRQELWFGLKYLFWSVCSLVEMFQNKRKCLHGSLRKRNKAPILSSQTPLEMYAALLNKTSAFVTSNRWKCLCDPLKCRYVPRLVHVNLGLYCGLQKH